MSTVGPDVIRELTERVPDDVDVIDAPVLGSIPQATDGTLKIFVGAEPDAGRGVDAGAGGVRPAHLHGPAGVGRGHEAGDQLDPRGLMSGLAEALTLADAFALDQSAVLDILAESPIGVTVKSKRDIIESGSFPPNFKLSLAVKDLRLVTGTAAERRPAAPPGHGRPGLVRAGRLAGPGPPRLLGRHRPGPATVP